MFECVFCKHKLHLFLPLPDLKHGSFTQVTAASVCGSHLICCKKNKNKCLCATERVGKNVLRAVLLRFTAPLRMALIWQWSVGFEEKCTASESLWTCTELSLRETHGPTWLQQDSKSKGSSVFALWHGDLSLNLLPAESPGPTVLQLWPGSRVASTLLHAG